MTNREKPGTAATTLEPGNSAPAAEETWATLPETEDTGERMPTAMSRRELQRLSRMPSMTRHPLRAAAWLVQVGWGLICLVVLLALAASVPIVNLAALGYLMEVQGRVARTGRFRAAFYLLPAAQRLGGILLAVWICLLPIQFLARLARDSWMLAAGGMTAWLSTGVLVVTSLIIAVHLLLAIGCGGAWWCFLRPVRNLRWLRDRARQGIYWQEAHQAIYEFVAALRLPHLLHLGLLGYAAAYLWLGLPALLFTMLEDVTSRWQVLVALSGGIMLTLILMWLPLLLVHVAVENLWRAMLAFATVRKLAGRTPLCWAAATAALFGCSIVPLLYTALLKSKLPPHDVRWDLMLVFLVTVVPARVLMGWVYHRASRRTRGTSTWPWRIWQGINVVALIVGMGWYVYFLYLAETGGELGIRAVWQFHALLLPLPF